MNIAVEQGAPQQLRYEKLKLRFDSGFMKDLRIQAKRFKRTRCEQLGYWTTVGMIFDALIRQNDALLENVEGQSELNVRSKRSRIPPSNGMASLLIREGGCTDLAEAVILYRGHRKSASRSTIVKEIEANGLISYPITAGGYWIPRWQFREEGGVLDGLDGVLQILSQRSGFSAVTPFVFFLQPAPRLKETPLNALRRGVIHKVIQSAREYCFL